MADLRMLVSWWNIFYNYKLLRHIFGYMSLKEQINMLDVCETFEFVISKVMWKEKYRTLHLYKTPYVTIIASAHETQYKEHGSSVDHAEQLDAIKQTKTALRLAESKRFLTANARNVQYVKVFGEYYDYDGYLGVTLNKIEIFANLQHLSYYKMVVTDEQVLLVGQHCKQLQKLEFIECNCAELEPLMLGENIKIESIAGMTRLEVLNVKMDPKLSAPQNEMDCETLLDLLNILKLKQLVLTNVTIVNSWLEVSSDIRLMGPSSLEVLDIGCISSEFWPRCKQYLKQFPNLRDLSIKVANCNTAVNVQVMGTLVETCTNLEKLSLENCDLHVENFCALAHLRQLSLSSCGGLTFPNLQQIMGGLKLERFTLINTRVLGAINHIYVSPSLQSITIDTILFTVISEAFEKSLNNFENLHTLYWLNGDINDNWIIDKCPNLKVLHIPNPYLLRRVVFTMKSLEEFTFTSCKGLSWRFIWILVKNLKLKRLHLYTKDTINDRKEIPESASNTITTLEMITLPFAIFSMAVDFWMNLLYCNEQLRILLYGSHENLMNKHFISSLLRHNHMPPHLRYIKICGFSVDINDLNNKFMEVLQQLNTYTSHYRSQNANFTIEI